MKILLLLALVASSMALQGPVEYFYKYEARVSTGLQAAHPQFSIASLKADVRITMKESTTGVVEFHNVQVGDANSQVSNNGRGPVNIDYSSIPTRELEQPYTVHFRKTEGETVMEVPQNDLLWVNNVRRGLASVFRIAPLMEPHSVQTSSNGRVEPQSFSRVEETYAGRCLVSYTVTPAAECDIPQPPSQDIQHQNARKGPGGDQIKIKSEFHRVQTSIDYSTCIDRPVFLQTGAGNLTNVTSSSFREVSSRSYVSQYILEGEPGKFRLSDAVIESHLIFNPYGIETEKMMVISNQTLTLSAARPAPTGHDIMAGIDKKPIKTWRQQAESPYSRPSGYTPRWVVPVDDRQPQGKKTIFYERMTSGFGLDEEQLRDWKDRAKQALERADQKLRQQNFDNKEQPEGYGGSNEGRIAQALESAHKLIRALTPEKLRELDQELSQSQGCQSCHELFIDALAVAGSGPSIDLLFQKIESRQVSDNRTASVLFTLGNNIQSPESIPRIMRYVMSVSEDQHVLVSLFAKVNFALLARRLCISKEYQPQSHFQYMFGDQSCKRSEIVSQYLPHLTSKIESSSKSWVKILNIFAAAELGAPESLQTLKRVARGEISSDKFVRFAAIHGMSRQSFDNSTRDQIWNILQPIAEDHTEDFRVRQIAYDTLLTWKPNSTFLHRMAYSSVTEPSAQIQSYIYWVLSTFAGLQDPQYQKESTAAQILLPITRYVNPSYNRAMSYFSARYQSYERAGEETQISWLAGLKSYFPREIYSKIKGQFGRFDVPLLQTVTLGNTEQAYLALRSAVDRLSSMQSTSEGQQKSDQMRKIHQALFGEKSSGESNEQQQPDIYYYLRTVRSSEIFLPLTNEMYEKASQQFKHGQKSLYNSYQSRITKYLNPVEVNVIIPLPVGLWSQIQVNTPTVMHSDMRVQGTFSPSVPSSLPSLSRLSISAEGMAKFITKVNTYAQVFAPWTNKTIMAAVDHEKSVSLPLKIESGSNFNMPTQEFWMQITPKFQQSNDKIPILKVRNLPYTAVGKILPSPEHQGSLPKFSNVKWVVDRNAYNQQQIKIAHENTGLRAMIQYQGEPDTPFSQANIYNYIMEPANLVTMLVSPSVKNYELTMYQLHERSDAKSIGLSIRHIQKDGSQVGSSSSLSVPQSANQPADITAGESVQQRESKISRFSNKINDELAVRLNFTGDQMESKIYEVSAIHSEDRRAESSKYQQQYHKLQVSLVQHNSESQGVQKTCMVGVIKRPMLQPQSTVSELQSALNQQSINSPSALNFFQGSQCSQGQQPVIKNDAQMKVSSNRVQEIMKVVQNNVFLYNTTNEFYRLAVYDRLDLTTTWQNRSPGLKNYTMWLQDLAEGYLYPNIVKNHMKQNSAKRMVVKADRSISDNRADAWVEMESFTAHAERIPIRGWFDSMTSFANDVFSHRGSGRQSVSSRSTGNQCHIHPTQVKTFDGINYEKVPTSCKTVAAKIRQGQESILIRAFQGQQSGEQVVEIESAIEQLEARITSQEAKVNGIEIPLSQSSKNIRDSAGNVVAKVLRHESFTQVTVPGKFQVVLKDGSHVMIKLDPRYKNFVQGMCGEFESQAGQQLMGPKNCLYTVSKSKEFAAAWVDGKQECSESQMQPLFQDVEKYEPHCEKARSGLSVPRPCEIQGYPIGSIGGNTVCVSKSRTPRCREGCSQSTMRRTSLSSKCWPSNEAPKQVLDNFQRGYITTPVGESAPIERSVTYDIPSGCQQERSNILSQTNSDVCFDRVYRIARFGSRLCVTLQQSQVCKESCSVTDTEAIQVQAGCWNESNAPSEVRSSEWRGYTTSRVTESPQFAQYIELLRPISCFTRG